MDERERQGRKLAEAVSALFNLQESNTDMWTSADEILNDAIFLLYEKAPVSDMDFAMYLVQAGCNPELASTLIDVPTSALQKYIAFEARLSAVLGAGGGKE